ncbi:MAG: DUF4255 domain-containing protein [Alphaproteobacteria bacterium]|nr:DUF4255 domain-containing protein [Alphaproteobacteria bacterium]
MSNALAIAAVTAVLRDLLNNGLIDHNVTGAVDGNVTVSTLPPDRIPSSGEDSATQLNLFMHQVTPNIGWRNVCLPSRDGRGDRLSNPPLALDLHYLLTAYGVEDLHAEILLGYAMQLLHETPVLSRGAITQALVPSPVNGTILPPAFAALAAADLADQVEQIKITPEALNIEEMSKLWAAFQANYRPTAAYAVSVVLIEANRATRAPLPVLTRGPGNQGVIAQASLTPPFPTIDAITPPDRRPSAELGDLLTMTGHHLDGANLTVRFESPRLAAAIELAPEPGATSTQVTVTLPDAPADPSAPADWAAGLYAVSISVERPSESFARTTNEVPLQIAPRMDMASVNAVRDAGTGAVTVTFDASPELRPNQTASLLLGALETPVEPHPVQTGTLSFVIADIDAGTYWARLRIDGVSSVLIDRTALPPVFDPSQQIVVPA